jgi:hypothetical protein
MKSFFQLRRFAESALISTFYSFPMFFLFFFVNHEKRNGVEINIPAIIVKNKELRRLTGNDIPSL